MTVLPSDFHGANMFLDLRKVNNIDSIYVFTQELLQTFAILRISGCHGRGHRVTAAANATAAVSAVMASGPPEPRAPRSWEVNNIDST